MKRFGAVLMVAALAIFSTACPNKCETAKTFQASVCNPASLDSPACMAATQAVQLACGPVPEPTPSPVPTPLPTPIPVPTPQPTPPAACSIPDVGSVAVSPVPASQYTAIVNAVLVELTGGTPQDRTVLLESQDSFNRRVVAQLLAHGICAAVQTGSDQITIGDATRGQNYKVFTCDGDAKCGGVPGCGCNHGGAVGWAPGSVKDTWVPPGPMPAPTPTPVPEPTPQPTPTQGPPTASGCPAGTPGPAKYIVSCRVRNANFAFCDSTPKVHDRDYCAPDLDCPYHGGEGSGERIACEKALATPAWTGADARQDNPFSADAKRGAAVSVLGPGGATGSAVAP